MGTFDQASIQHASALHWAETIGRSRWVRPERFWIHEQGIPVKLQPMSHIDKLERSLMIFDGDVIIGLKKADTFFVDRDIAVWLVTSSRGRPPMKLERWLLPAPGGYVWFDHPYLLAGEADSSVLGLRALQWCLDPSTNLDNEVIGDGIDMVRIIPWMDIGIAGTSSTTPALRYGGLPLGSLTWKLGSWDFRAPRPTDHGFYPDGEMIADDGLRIDALIGVNNSGVSAERRAEMYRTSLDVMTRIVEVFGTLLLFMQQRILVSGRERPSRAARKQIERSQLQTSDVSVITLRKKHYLHAEQGGEGESSVHWNWRWPVSSHWRHFKHGQRLDRPIFVHSYVKGPADRPLKPANEKIFAVVQ